MLRNSLTGVPEGDPVSVVAAVMIGTLWHWYVSDNPNQKVDIDLMSLWIYKEDLATGISLSEEFCDTWK